MFVPLTFTLAVGENARMRREAESMRKSPGRGREGFGLGWLGDRVAFGVTDRSGFGLHVRFEIR